MLRSPRNTFPALLSGRSRSGLEIPTGPADCLWKRHQERKRQLNEKDWTAPYSCQEGPSFALTSTYTLATDFVDVLPIAEKLTMLVVMVDKRGCRDVERPIESAITTGTAMPRSPTSKSSTYTPPHWPGHVRYLTTQQYHLSVEKDVLEIIRGRRPRDFHQPQAAQPSLVVIRQITGPSDHPASIFCVCKDDRCPTQPTVSILQAGCGTVRAVCDEKDPAPDAFVGLSRRSSL